MKKSLTFLLLIILSISTFAQENNFDLLLEQKSDDTELVTKLTKFRDSGIGLELELDSLTPQQIIDTAKSYIGTPHCMGGVSHKCIDCSGLLYATFKNNGVRVPHGSEAMAHYGEVILNIDSLQAGDLVFFVKTYNTSKVITHSGIYIGNYEFIHTSSSKGVVISNLKSNYYQEHYIFSTRVF